MTREVIEQVVRTMMSEIGDDLADGKNVNWAGYE